MNRRIFAAGVLLCALAPSLATAQQVELKFKFDETPQRRVSTTRFDQKLSIAGMDIPTSVNLTESTLVTTRPRGDSGDIGVTVKVEGIRAHFELPGNTVADFDSAKPDTKTGNPALDMGFETLRALSGSEYSYEVNKDQKVVAVKGLDSVVAKLPAASQEEIKKELSAETLSREWSEQLRSLPSGPVKKGDSWTRTEVLSRGGETLTFETSYEFEGEVEKDGKKLLRVRIFQSGVKYAVVDNPNNPAKVTASDLKIDSSTGHYLFDPISGSITERQFTARISGTLGLSVNGMELPAKLELTVESGMVKAPTKP